ncbi:MAG: hypothetical protein JWM34_3302 [Ilumatobacteraceae bacterium]|nr:hypothetical protein [Ilumatobacteraceae bacterium]
MIASVGATATASVVSLVVGGAVGSTQTYLKGRGSEVLAARRLRKHGDHIALSSQYGSSLDSRNGTALVAGVAAAPSMSLRRKITLNADIVEEWRRKLPQAAALPRDYLNPDELIRYRVDDFNDPRQLVITPAGLIDTTQPVEHHMDANNDPAVDLVAFISAIVPPVVAISDGAHRLLFEDQLRTKRLDWRIELSRSVQGTDRISAAYGPSSAKPWRSIKFPKSAPSAATPGQQAPMNQDGLGADQLRNIAADTRPAIIVNAAVRSLVMRSGYSGINGMMAEVARMIDDEIASYRHAHY